jgi:hypothetical protein
MQSGLTVNKHHPDSKAQGVGIDMALSASLSSENQHDRRSRMLGNLWRTLEFVFPEVPSRRLRLVDWSTNQGPEEDARAKFSLQPTTNDGKSPREFAICFPGL